MGTVRAISGQWEGVGSRKGDGERVSWSVAFAVASGALAGGSSPPPQLPPPSLCPLQGSPCLSLSLKT